MYSINAMKIFTFVIFSFLLTACMPPEVWKKPGVDTVEESRLRKECYKSSEGDGVSTSLEVTSKFDRCMKNSGFIKTPQWQQN